MGHYPGYYGPPPYKPPHKKKKRRFRWPLWMKRLRQAFAQLLLPLVCFQLLRTLFLPTTVDVFLLIFLLILYLYFLFTP